MISVLLIAILCLSGVQISNTNVSAAVKKVTFPCIPSGSVVVEKDETYAISTAYNGKKSSSSNWMYQSSDPAIVVVSNEGIITGISEGKATITVKHKKTKVTKTFVAIVGEQTTEIDADAALKVPLNTAVRLEATSAPSTAALPGIVFKSGNPKIATVSSTGKVIGKKTGTVTITMWSKDSRVKKTMKLTVTNDREVYACSSLDEFMRKHNLNDPKTSIHLWKNTIVYIDGRCLVGPSEYKPMYALVPTKGLDDKYMIGHCIGIDKWGISLSISNATATICSKDILNYVYSFDLYGETARLNIPNDYFDYFSNTCCPIQEKKNMYNSINVSKGTLYINDEKVISPDDTSYYNSKKSFTRITYNETAKRKLGIYAPEMAKNKDYYYKGKLIPNIHN
ncbi:MAG: Ig-like domain-containing protein [Lachnospiraceae bacterium]